MTTTNQNSEASAPANVRPSSVQKDTIEITADTPEYMQRHGWKLAGTTSDVTVLGEIKFSYQEEGCAVAFTRAKEGGNIIYWIHDGDTVSQTVSKSTCH